MFWTKNKHPKCHIWKCEDCQWLDIQNHCCNLKKTAKINQCDFCRNAYNDMRLHGEEDYSSISIFRNLNSAKECLEFAQKLDELNIKTTNTDGSYLSFEEVIEEIKKKEKTKVKELSPTEKPLLPENEVEEKIEIISVHPEKENKPATENFSVRTEKPSKKNLIVSSQLKDKVEKAPTENSVQTEKEPQKSSLKDFRENVLTLFTSHIKYGAIKAYFDPDNKGGGTRFVPSELARIMSTFFLQSLTKDRTPLKHCIQESIEQLLKSFDYTITLNGRKQPIKAFAGILAGTLCDKLEDITNRKKDGE